MTPADSSSSTEKSQYLVGETVGVLLPLPLSGIYDYRVPEGLRLAPGDVVTVPLGRRIVTGVVWGPPQGGVPEAKLKAVAARRDTPPMTDVQRRFIDWIAAYTLNPPGAVLKMALSVPEALDPPAPTTAYVAVRSPPAFKETPARRRALAVAAEGPPRTAADLAREAAVGPAVVKGLAKAGALETVSLPSGAPPEKPDWRRQGPTLSADQAEAAASLGAKAAADGFSVTLLDGVPGSGKTEVYFQAIAETFARGRQALVLLPEIALGAQWLERFRRRFGALPVEWHSDLTQTQRRAAWRHVAEGAASVVVGARSALFLPFPDLGLIVVDEEHDSSFKQEDGPIYNARDMAVVRARLGNHAIVLASATPSLETSVNADLGRYGRLHLPDRHAGAVLPKIDVVDMRTEKLPAGRWLSDPLKTALSETFAAKEQAILFLNRRGYAPLTLCRHCGHRMNCPRCTAWLVEHRLGGGRVARLQCHHCGFAAPMPNECPSCAAEDSFAACGPGVERLAEEVAAAFPEVRVAIAASDNLQGPRAASDLMRRVEEHAVDLVIGTQIVAKGHHFPMLTLVGVVDADLGLSGGDLRAAERTYQLLYQVAGRAGRGALPGRVLLQTFMPEHPVMKALTSGERERFIAAETDARRRDGMPPFGRLAAVIVSGPDEAQVDAHARALARAAPRDSGIQVLGPAPAPFALLRGRHRRRFLVKAGKEVPIQPILARWMDACPTHGSVRAQVDVDPYSFL